MNTISQADRDRIEGEFVAFCLSVIKHEAYNIHRELDLRNNKFKSLDDLTLSELNQLSTTDTYFMDEQTFTICTKPDEKIKVVVVNSDLYSAMKRLPPDKLDIILYSYFLNKTDREIAEQNSVVQSTVCRRRQKILQLLKELIAEEEDK